MYVAMKHSCQILHQGISCISKGVGSFSKLTCLLIINDFVFFSHVSHPNSFPSLGFQVAQLLTQAKLRIKDFFAVCLCHLQLIPPFGRWNRLCLVIYLGHSSFSAQFAWSIESFCDDNISLTTLHLATVSLILQFVTFVEVTGNYAISSSYFKKA